MRAGPATQPAASSPDFDVDFRQLRSSHERQPDFDDPGGNPSEFPRHRHRRPSHARARRGGRPHPLARPLRALRGDADDRPRRDDRQRRPALDPGRPRLLPEQSGLGDQRLHDPVRRVVVAGGADRRPGRAASRLPRWPRRLHPGLARVRSLPDPGDAGRRPFHPGSRRGDGLGGDPGDDRDDVPGPPRRRKRSGFTGSSPPPAARSGCCSAASSPTRSAGTGSSSSTSRSGSGSPSWRRGWSRAARGSACTRAPTTPARR